MTHPVDRWLSVRARRQKAWAQREAQLLRELDRPQPPEPERQRAKDSARLPAPEPPREENK